MAVYTEGPWELGNALQGEGYTAINGVGWDQFATVVTRMRGDTEDSPEGVANARLICAAPDLLTALQWVLETHSPTGGSAKAAAVMAAAAIAKAKGE